MLPRTHEPTTARLSPVPVVRSWVRGSVGGSVGGSIAALLLGATLGAQAGKPVNYKGVEMSVAGVERAATASLKDCPPGGNTVNATTRPGEEFAVVKVSFKVLPAFQAGTVMKRPTITDAAGKTYNTAVSFVDVGSVPEFSCAIPFRVPAGTALKSFQVDTASLDLTAADKK